MPCQVTRVQVPSIRKLTTWGVIILLTTPTMAKFKLTIGCQLVYEIPEKLAVSFYELEKEIIPTTRIESVSPESEG